MKVSELIELLQYQDKDAEVHFSYNYGDHWRTQVAPAVRDVTFEHVVYSEYHRMDKMIEEDRDIYNEDGTLEKGVREVVVIG